MSSIEMKKCALCKEEKPLCNSHVIPKFVTDWMKETGSSYLRRVTTPNKREQDGLKTELLCFECEQLFSKEESWFSSKIFIPIVTELFETDGRKVLPSYEYNEHMFRFCISIVWRALYVNLQDKERLSASQQVLLMSAEAEWRDFLLNYKYPYNFDKIHMIILDKSMDSDEKPEGFDFYIMRAPDATIAGGKNVAFIYAKFPKFLFIAPLEGLREQDFENTLIYAGKSKLTFPQFIHDGRFGAFLVNRVKVINSMMDKISQNQQDKIHEQMLKEKDKILYSDMMRAFDENKNQWP